MNNMRSPPSLFNIIENVKEVNMKNNIIDYYKNTFKRRLNKKGNYIYYIKVFD